MIEDIKDFIEGAAKGLAFVGILFFLLGAVMAWLFYAVPWVYAHAPTFGLPNDFGPFFIAAAMAMAGPAMIAGGLGAFK